MDEIVGLAAELTPAEGARYARQTSLTQWGPRAQRRLKASRALVIGAGGLGSPSLLYLAAAGVGRLGVVDADVVDLSNLQRQVIHAVADVGRAKTASAAAHLRALNPEITVVEHPVRLSADNVLEIFSEYDIVVDGSDNFATRYLANDACVMLGIPLVWASVLGFHGQVSVFWAAKGPCYRCLFPHPPAAGEVPSCVEAGVLGVVPGALGMAQATEVLKLLGGVGSPLVGRVAVLDALAGTWGTLPLRRNPDCPLCGLHPTITSLRDESEACSAPGTAVQERTMDVATLAAWLDERARGERDFVLVDVREPHEWAINRIPGAVDLRMDDVLAGGLELPVGVPAVLYCHTGGRSERLLRSLLGRGTDAWHVAGGVTAWVRDRDPAQQVY